MAEVSQSAAAEVSAPAGAQAPAGQAAPVSSETPSQSGQASPQAQSAPAEDRFSNIDPETLPPELKAIYKNLQADYTKKTQASAELRKKAQSYDQIVARPDFKDYWQGLNRTQKAEFKEQKAEAEKRLGEIISDEEFSKSMQTKDGFLEMIAKVNDAKSAKTQKEIAELKQYRSVTEASNLVESFATETGEDGKPLRPDFFSLDEDQLISGYLNINPPSDKATPQEFRAKLNEAYTWAQNLSHKYYEKGKAETLKTMTQKAANSTEPPTPPAKQAYTGPDPKKLTVREAIELAKKGQRVPRGD